MKFLSALMKRCVRHFLPKLVFIQTMVLRHLGSLTAKAARFDQFSFYPPTDSVVVFGICFSVPSSQNTEVNGRTIIAKTDTLTFSKDIIIAYCSLNVAAHSRWGSTQKCNAEE